MNSFDNQKSKSKVEIKKRIGYQKKGHLHESVKMTFFFVTI